jgi:hypothetical protein
MKITKYEIVLTIAFLIVLFFSVKSCSSNKKELNEKDNLNRVVNDSMVTYRNNLHQQIAKIEPLITTNDKYFLELKTKDAIILKLQQLYASEKKAKRDAEVAMVIAIQTVSQLQDSLKNTVIGQTFTHKGDSIFVWPTYQKVISNKWVLDSIQIGKNFFKQHQVIHNEYDIAIGTERAGLFKTKPYALVTNINPLSETTAIRVYQKKEVPSKFWSYIGGGVIGGALVWLIKSL